MSLLSLSRSTPTARKAHRCHLCHRVIAPGETYERQENVFDGRFYLWKGCAHCKALMSLRTEIREVVEDWDEGWTDDVLCDWQPATVWEARLRAQYRRRWTRLDGSLYPLPTTPKETKP